MEPRRSMRIKEQIKYEEEESSSGSESGCSSEERRSEDDSKQKRLKEEREKKGGRKKRKGKKKRGWNAGTTTRTTWTKAKSESEPESFGEEDEKQESAFLSKYHLKKVKCSNFSIKQNLWETPHVREAGPQRSHYS